MADSLFLIVGLGNPGSEYARTRHNIGFHVIEELARRWALPRFTKKFHSLVGESTKDGGKRMLMMPQTFMNRSGLAVGEAVTFFKIPKPTHLLVVYDDLDLPPAAIRIRAEGGSGGHNGMKSIIEALGGDDFPRIRIGIGRSPSSGTDHVLGTIPQSEESVFEKAVGTAADAVEMFLSDGLARAMNTFNRKGDEKNGG